jgi:hypothetical protein
MPVEGREPGVDGLLAAFAARDDLDDARRQPGGGPRSRTVDGTR